MEKLICECSVEICTTPVKVKIFNESGKEDVIISYSFELSHYFKGSDDAEIYIPSNRAETLDRCLYILTQYIRRFKDIDKIEENINI